MDSCPASVPREARKRWELPEPTGSQDPCSEGSPSVFSQVARFPMNGLESR